jgi:hypothetical protein
LPLAGPRAVYLGRLEERAAARDRLGLRERLIGNARLGVFLLGVALAFLSFGQRTISAWWLLVPLAAFVVLLFVHEKVTRAWFRAGRAVSFYRRGLARLDEKWMGQGQQGLRFQNEEHPYAADLDLFGKDSLFELLCTARTRTGEDTLAAWLLGPASSEEIRARQGAVAELREQLDLREDLALLGDDVNLHRPRRSDRPQDDGGVDFDAVARWGASPPLLRFPWLRWPLLALGTVTLFCLYQWLVSFSLPANLEPDEVDKLSFPDSFFLRYGPWPFLVLCLVQMVIASFFLPAVLKVLSVVEKRSRDLALLANVLARLEQAQCTSPRLRRLQEMLEGPHHERPSQRIAQLGNLLDLLASRRNPLFLPFAPILMWGTQMALALEGWRRHSGAEIRGWLDAVGQFEALCALATYAFENPADPFPEIVEGEPLYQGRGLGHPLLPRAKCVRNDLDLGTPVHVLLVSGSNMSGKSTYLRTIGINAVLALAGAPVRADSLRLTPLALGATLRIQDSLQEGKSRFYAELLRVRQVVDLSRGTLPLLFLLDEIFAGTNSHDRRQGAEAVVLGLARRGALGLVTTHDLTLTQMAEELGDRARNVHFADRFERGEMHFDYRVHDGVVRNSNALALMRAVGLEV